MEAIMVKLKIEGMTCGHCVLTVKQALSGVTGVQAPVDVSLEKGEAVVGGAPDPQALMAALVQEGFQPTSWVVVE